MEKRYIYKKVYISLFLVILFIPFIAGVIQKKYEINLDKELFGIRRLIGYTKAIEGLVPFSFENYTSSKFQKNFTEFLEEKIPLKRVLVRTFSTLQFVLFGELNRSTDMVLGKENNIFTKGYIYTLFAVGQANNYSDSKNLEELKSFIGDLVQLQDRLSKLGKFLYVYIAPSKATIQKDYIPDKYLTLRHDGRKDVVTAFDEIASKTKLNYWLAKDLKLDPKYPPFYKTGIHWSRTYEQKATQKIIEDIKRISKNPYGDIFLGKIRHQKKCFWRDCDMIGLSNAWIHIPQKYYEYQMRRQSRQEHQQMKFLIYGDSYSLGLLNDIGIAYPDAKLYHTTRNDLFSNKKERVRLKKDYNNLDYKKYLDDSDGVIIEMAEPEIRNYTFGFVKHLIKILSEAE